MSNSKISAQQDQAGLNPSKTANQHSQTELDFSPDPNAVSVDPRGDWMYMQQATEATGLSEKTLRRYIKKGILKHKRMGKAMNSPLKVFVTPDFMQKVAADTEIVEAIDQIPDQPTDEDDDLDVQDGPVAEPTHAAVPINVQSFLQEQAKAFADEIEKRTEIIHSLRQELDQKESALKLLPNLQKEMKDKEDAIEREREDLRKELVELQQSNEQLKKENERLEELNKRSWWKTWLGLN